MAIGDLSRVSWLLLTWLASQCATGGRYVSASVQGQPLNVSARCTGDRAPCHFQRPNSRKLVAGGDGVGSKKDDERDRGGKVLGSLVYIELQGELSVIFIAVRSVPRNLTKID